MKYFLIVAAVFWLVWNERQISIEKHHRFVYRPYSAYHSK